jgi:hypothetical protein
VEVFLMDLFALDRQVVEFIKRLMTDPMLQFSIIAGIGAVVSGLFPDSKSSRGNKK